MSTICFALLSHLNPTRPTKAQNVISSGRGRTMCWARDLGRATYLSWRPVRHSIPSTRCRVAVGRRERDGERPVRGRCSSALLGRRRERRPVPAGRRASAGAPSRWGGARAAPPAPESRSRRPPATRPATPPPAPPPPPLPAPDAAGRAAACGTARSLRGGLPGARAPASRLFRVCNKQVIFPRRPGQVRGGGMPALPRSPRLVLVMVLTGTIKLTGCLIL